MTRHVLKLGVLLALGAIANIAIAWSIWLVHGSGQATPQALTNIESAPTDEFDQHLWRSHAGPQWQPPPPLRIDETHRGFRCRYLLKGGPGVFAVASTECGVPLRCMRLDRWGDVNLAATTRHDGLLVRGRDMPVRIIAGAFLLNTLAIALGAWLLFLAPLAIRKVMRVRRGECAGCGYPIGSSSVCTECGKPVKPKHVEQAT